MITPMRHVTMLCQAEDAVGMLDVLREAGVMHLEIARNLDHDLEREEEALDDAEQVIRKLEGVEPEAGEVPEADPWEIVELVLRREAQIREIQALCAKLRRELSVWEPFGDLDLGTLGALERGGVRVRFYRTGGDTPEMGKGVTWIPGRDGFGLGMAFGEEPEVKAEEVAMPVRSARTLRGRLERLEELGRRHGRAIARRAMALDALKAYRDEMEDVLEYTRAYYGMRQAEELQWIGGYVPEDRLEAVKEVAEGAGAGLFSRAPEEDDEVPTLLKHSRVVSWIQPVFDFLGVTPGYREVDVGWTFLIFLSVFSGMISGAGGFGVLLGGWGGGLNLFKPGTRGKFANMLYLMGGATVIWGVLTGNLFGMDPAPGWLSRVKIDALADLSDPKPVMNVCFVLGAGHLTLAHLWNLWLKRRSVQALAELGWIGSTWTMYCVTGVMVLGWEELPGFVVPMFLVSAVLIVVFMTPPAKLKEEWVQHMMLPLSFVNNFVDVVSYVRLYAVGMATFALASSFNEMILGGDAERHILMTGVMMIILVLGHALNFILAGMGIMVHGIRLNTLEFASHMGLTWSGIPYRPFKRTGGRTERGEVMETTEALNP